MDHSIIQWFMGKKSLSCQRTSQSTKWSTARPSGCRPDFTGRWPGGTKDIAPARLSMSVPPSPGLPGQDSVLLGLCLFLVIFQQIPACTGSMIRVNQNTYQYANIPTHSDKSTMISFLSTCEFYLRPLRTDSKIKQNRRPDELNDLRRCGSTTRHTERWVPKKAPSVVFFRHPNKWKIFRDSRPPTEKNPEASKWLKHVKTLQIVIKDGLTGFHHL